LEQTKLKEICRDFYSKLYIAATTLAGRAGASGHTLTTIGDRMTEEMKASLKSPIGIHELEEALKTMAKGKAPWPDGVIINFYKSFWALIRDDYH
jgi:hypothetical protein